MVMCFTSDGSLITNLKNNKMNDELKIISVRENPEYKELAIIFFQTRWPSVSAIIYEDCITHCLSTVSPVPHWYLLEKDGLVIGGAGVIMNDFISRMDLYPWVCAVYIDEEYRGHSYASLLLEKAKEDCRKGGFDQLYLCTSHIGFYEKYGFKYIGQGYHPWNEESRIYEVCLKKEDGLEFSIRPEIADDYDGIYSLIQTAFQTAKVKDGDEQDFAVGLRNGKNYLPELALVAEAEGKLIGHIMLTKTIVLQPSGDQYEALLLAPISVLLEYRDMGVGAALIKESFRIARSMGYSAVFLCGDPGYYNQFGFKQTTVWGIRPKNNIPEQYVLACELSPKALEGVSGVVACC